jgi:mannose/cellobiose epimerase-like protein (N-acyl-D-glucosamine 2-epimerase family)
LGNDDAAALGAEAWGFIAAHLVCNYHGGFHETTARDAPRRSNPHMHLLEACFAWYSATGEAAWLTRSAAVIALFKSCFFDTDTSTLGEYFNKDRSLQNGAKGLWTEPGHHIEWTWLLIAYASAANEPDLNKYARKLYASAIANGLNRATGLAYDAVSKDGLPLIRTSRSWPQTEAIKAAIALDGTGGPDMKPEIESRVGRLFRWHIDPAPQGMRIDLIDERGRTKAQDVPASIFYHLVCALTAYLGAKSE